MMAGPHTSIVVTGGAGFIGSSLVRHWLKHESERVIHVDKLTYAGLRLSLEEALDHPRHVLVEGDVADARLMADVLRDYRPAAIIHLAAETHVDRSIDQPPRFVHANVLGTCTLLDQATNYWRQLNSAERSAFRFVLASTDEVFGSAEADERFDAQSPLAPNSPYAASKAAGEHLARAFFHTYGLPVVTLNPTNNYGPRQMPEKLIPRMIVAAWRCQPLPVYGDGLQQRDWLHVEDCCTAIRTVLRRGAAGRRYLAGADQIFSNLSVVERICRLLDERLDDGNSRRTLVRHVADRPGHDRRYAVDSRSLRDLGWSPAVSFDAGLPGTVDWYLQNLDWIAAAEESLGRRGA
ncbi:MAG: dTDP-glucose 4,6-dehydratase [Pirellulales bacterium]|nr:dTDP-glucose 4,6-dehydratase [Pirellulales bacterium]